MPQCHSKKWMVPARVSVKRSAVEMIFYFGAKPAGEHFFKKWLGIYKLFSSLSPSREQIGAQQS
jgi:hypothetical protein